MKTTAREIAATIAEKSRERGIADLSNLKLQRLLGYAQAWNLVFTGKPLFPDPTHQEKPWIEARRSGARCAFAEPKSA